MPYALHQAIRPRSVSRIRQPSTAFLAAVDLAVIAIAPVEGDTPNRLSRRFGKRISYCRAQLFRCRQKFRFRLGRQVPRISAHVNHYGGCEEDWREMQCLFLIHGELQQKVRR